MTRRPAPLPAPFDGRPFTTAAATAGGITRGRLRSRDLVAPRYGVRHPAGVPPTLLYECCVLALRLPSAAAFSHVTAARLWQLPLPLTLERSAEIDVTVPQGVRARRGQRVRGHQCVLEDADVDRRSGVRATTPERTFCDLAPLLTLGELVAVGDAVLRRGDTGAARVRLDAAVARHAARRHRRRLQRAVALLDADSESPKESELRILLVDAGFPAPTANLSVFDDDGTFVARVDLAYPRLRIAVEYEGDHHRERDQWRRDIRRRRRLEALGWIYLSVTQADLDDATGLRADLTAAIARRSPDRTP